MNRQDLITIGTANELKLVNRTWKIPFGCYEHQMGLQVFGLKEARDCAAYFNEQMKVPGFNGAPVYIGHPDVKSFQDKYRDHAAYAWITEMTVNETEGCLELVIKYTPPGEQLIANEQFVYFSPLWLSTRRGRTIHPFGIKSVGLTQEPNIQYLAVACEELNEEPENQGVKMDLKKLRDCLKSRWKNETALDEAPNELVIDEAIALLEAHETELAAANEAVPDSATATITQLNAEIESANESITAMRSAHSKLLLDVALQDGRITPATRSKWEGKFGAEGADFDAVANELADIDPVMKTRSITKGIDPSKIEQKTHADLRAEATELANEKHIAYDAAYGQMKKKPEFAHLFTAE